MKKFTTKDFKHETSHQWTDISSEKFRVYEFGNAVVKIEGPLFLSVSKAGGHRVFDEQGISHYIPSGYNHLYWQVKEGQPHFVK